ncbi:MAG: hypothetical protein Q8N98_04575, partial [bacterium]|nr:hypothetical protein [bacterium]
QACRREILFLKNIGFVKPKKKKIQGWKLNESFPLLLGFKSFILDSASPSRDQLLKKLQKTGRVKLVILAGIFGEDNSSPVDIFVVGDAIRKGALDRAIRDIEAEVGKELTYTFFSTQDFLYRMGMYDKFIRDILDYPHEKILDKLGV